MFLFAIWLWFLKLIMFYTRLMGLFELFFQFLSFFFSFGDFDEENV